MLFLAEGPSAEIDAQKQHPIAVLALAAPLAAFGARAADGAGNRKEQGQYLEHVQHALMASIRVRRWSARYSPPVNEEGSGVLNGW